MCEGSLTLSGPGSALALRRPAYKAREILREDEYAAPADVWAYGVTLLQLGTGHVAGGTSAARRAIVGYEGPQWTLQQALAGAFHDKFTRAGEEEDWGAACAVQRAAWGGAGRAPAAPH